MNKVVCVLAVCILASAGWAVGPSGASVPPVLLGKVVETLNASRYTYVLVDTGHEKIWAAAPAFTVQAGDSVSMASWMPMANFFSKSLNRRFDVLYMCDQITVGEAGSPKAPAPGMALPAGHPQVEGMAGACPSGVAANEAVANEVVAPAPGSLSIADLWSARAGLSGKTVTVRGRVVKALNNILGKNWIHLRDGTGQEGSNDLVVTTEASLTVGTKVTMSGILKTDVDLGSGYHFGMMVENATVVSP